MLGKYNSLECYHAMLYHTKTGKIHAFLSWLTHFSKCQITFCNLVWTIFEHEWTLKWGETIKEIFQFFEMSYEWFIQIKKNDISILLILLISIPANGRLRIVKKCGLSPCSLSDINSWTDECDRKSDEDSYTCTSCCRDTTCNGQGTLSLDVVCQTLFILIVISFKIHFTINS